jgi:predicted esterase YcpF (UPF0227 family)
MPLADRRPLYYFHGFNSAIPEDISTSPKISAVAEYAARAGRAFLPQNIDYRQVRRHASELLDHVAQDVDEVLYCGASMGGWFARIMQCLLAQRRPGLKIEAVVFNPAFNLVEFSHMLEGRQVNYVTLEEYDWTPAHSAAMVALEASIDYRADLPFRVYVDRDDEVIDAGWSEDWHRGYANFVAFAGGDHSFQHSREALDDYDNGCWKRPLQ